MNVLRIEHIGRTISIHFWSFENATSIISLLLDKSLRFTSIARKQEQANGPKCVQIVS